MEFREIRGEEKRRFLPLLMLGDEQEDMVLRYLDRGTLYALYEADGLRSAAVVTEEDGALELKNLSVRPGYQRRGYGRAMMDFWRRPTGAHTRCSGRAPGKAP